VPAELDEDAHAEAIASARAAAARWAAARDAHAGRPRGEIANGLAIRWARLARELESIRHHTTRYNQGDGLAVPLDETGQ